MRYAVIPAEGHYGDHAIVVSTHSTQRAADRAASGNWQVVIVPDEIRKGSTIPRAGVRMHLSDRATLAC